MRKKIGTMGVACGRLEPHPSNFGIFFKVFWPIFPQNLEVIGLAKLDLWLDQFTIVLLYACQMHLGLCNVRESTDFIFEFAKFLFYQNWETIQKSTYDYLIKFL